MAVLDRFLNVMFDKDAEAVVLETDKQVVLAIESGRHPVTKDPINTPKILNLVRESSRSPCSPSSMAVTDVSRSAICSTTTVSMRRSIV